MESNLEKYKDDLDKLIEEGELLTKCPNHRRKNKK